MFRKLVVYCLALPAPAALAGCSGSDLPTVPPPPPPGTVKEAAASTGVVPLPKPASPSARGGRNKSAPAGAGLN